MKFAFHLFRICLRLTVIAVLVLISGWLWLDTSNKQDVKVISGKAFDSKPPGQTTMKVSPYGYTTTSDRAALLMSEASDGGFSTERAREMLEMLSDTESGAVASHSFTGASPTRTNGAKFVRVD